MAECVTSEDCNGQWIVTPISRNDCIGNSLNTINQNFKQLDEYLCNLYTIVDQISSSMTNTLGNYPYVRLYESLLDTYQSSNFTTAYQKRLFSGMEVVGSLGFVTHTVGSGDFQINQAGVYEYLITAPNVVKLKPSGSVLEDHIDIVLALFEGSVTKNIMKVNAGQWQITQVPGGSRTLGDSGGGNGVVTLRGRLQITSPSTFSLQQKIQLSGATTSHTVFAGPGGQVELWKVN